MDLVQEGEAPPTARRTRSRRAPDDGVEPQPRAQISPTSEHDGSSGDAPQDLDIGDLPAIGSPASSQTSDVEQASQADVAATVQEVVAAATAVANPAAADTVGTAPHCELAAKSQGPMSHLLMKV